MYKTCVSRWLAYLPALAVVLTLASCFGSKKAQKELTYLQGNLDTLPNLTVPVKETTIQKGDLLSIIFFSDNPEATAIYNQQQIAVPSSTSAGGVISGSTSSNGSGNLITNGYQVDPNGDIYIQSLGRIHVEGLTRSELSTMLSDKLTPYLKNPYANVRFLNSKITVFGEVSKPGSYAIPLEKVSVLEVLGMAGDLTVYGRRDNILVIREQNGKREFGRIDLRNRDLFQSPYYYLQQNDIVYVYASAKKPTVNDQATLRNLSLVTVFTSLISATAIIINVIR